MNHPSIPYSAPVRKSKSFDSHDQDILPEGMTVLDTAGSQGTTPCELPSEMYTKKSRLEITKYMYIYIYIHIYIHNTCVLAGKNMRIIWATTYHISHFSLAWTAWPPTARDSPSQSSSPSQDPRLRENGAVRFSNDAGPPVVRYNFCSLWESPTVCELEVITIESSWIYPYSMVMFQFAM